MPVENKLEFYEQVIIQREADMSVEDVSVPPVCVDTLPTYDIWYLKLTRTYVNLISSTLVTLTSVG